MSILLGGCAYDTLLVTHLIELSEYQQREEQSRATIQLLLACTISTLKNSKVVQATTLSCPYGTVELRTTAALNEFIVYLIPGNISQNRVWAECTIIVTNHEITVRDFKYQ